MYCNTGCTAPPIGPTNLNATTIEGGFTPTAAARIVTLNGAICLGRKWEIGSIAVKGKVGLFQALTSRLLR
jgi:hypothetical protein